MLDLQYYRRLKVCKDIQREHRSGRRLVAPVSRPFALALCFYSLQTCGSDAFRLSLVPAVFRFDREELFFFVLTLWKSRFWNPV